MRTQSRILASIAFGLAVFAGSWVWADEPAKPAGSDAQAPTQPATTSAPPMAKTDAVPAAATAAGTRAADPGLAAEVKHLMARGYRPETHNGNTVYCHKEAPLGSRFEKKTCTTPELSAKTRENSRDDLTSAQKDNGNPINGH